MRIGSGNNFIINIRTRLGLTQVQMAEKMGCSRSTFCNLESGKTPILSAAAKKFVQASGCLEAELVLGAEMPRNPDGTLMQEPDYEQMHLATVADYEKQLEQKNTVIESIRNSLKEKELLVKAQEKIINNQEREIARLEKSLSRYEAA